MRRLPEAITADARARAAGGAPIPIKLLLTLLAKLESWAEEGVIRFVERIEPDAEDGDGA